MAGINEKFFELPEEKRLRIINAGFEVFGKNDYKRASTEEIASKAGISKGLLFYYFHDKKTLYLFLYDYAEKLLERSVVDSRFSEITDVFELFEYAAVKKYQIMLESPHILDFVMRAFYSQGEAVSGELDGRLARKTEEIFGSYLSGLDFSKFREDVDPREVMEMLAWAADGYMHSRQRLGMSVDLDDLMEKYRKWSAYFKKMSYREEYL